MKVFVKGQGSVTLRKSDFLAQGGEGSVYVKGDTAFKVYADPKRAISAGKIAELAAIADDRVIKPEGLLLDGSAGRVIGYSMRHVADTWPLCRMFARSFKERHKLDVDAMSKLVQELALRFHAVHAGGALIVDANEMNFLVAADFGAVFAIDVDSYQTAHHPATAISPSIRDPWTIDHGFDPCSDWFAFAVIATQLLVGVHPFKGKHPRVSGLEARMRQLISVFDPEVRLPKVAYGLDVIPSELRGWLESVLQRGERRLPPRHFGAATLISTPTTSPTTADILDVRRLHRLGSTVRMLVGHGDVLWAVCDDGIYRDGKRIDDAPAPGALLALTPGLDKAVVAHVAGGELLLYDVQSKVKLQAPARPDAAMTSGGRIYFKSGDKILELLLRDVGASVIASARLAASVLPHATKLFDGLAVQSLLGATYLSLFPRSGVHQQLRVRELDGREVVAARADGNVALLLLRDGDGYQHAWLRLGPQGYDLRLETAQQAMLLPFAVLDSGACVTIREDESIEIFAARMGQASRRVLRDDAISTRWLLGTHRGKLLCANDDEVLHLSSQTQPKVAS